MNSLYNILKFHKLKILLVFILILIITPFLLYDKYLREHFEKNIKGKSKKTNYKSHNGIVFSSRMLCTEFFV